MKEGRIACLILWFSIYLVLGASPILAVANINPRTVTVAVCPHTPPFQFLDEEFQLSGIHIDLMENVAQENNLLLHYLPYNTMEECVKALDRGAADIVLGYQVQEYDQTEHLVTSELSTATISIVANRNLVAYIEETQRTTPFTIAFEYGSVDYSLLNSMGFRKLISVGNQEQAVDALLEQRADTVVGVRESIDYQLGDQERFQTLHEQVDTIHYAILVREDLPAVYRLLNQSLVDLHTRGIYSEIYQNWVPDLAGQQAKLIGRFLIVVATGAFLISAVVLWFNYLLRRTVALKTRMLSEANQSLAQTITRLQDEAVFRNQMIDSLPIPAVLFDPQFSVTLMNPKAQTVCGLSGSGWLGLNICTLPVFGEILAQLGEDARSGDIPRERRYVFDVQGKNSPRKYRCWIHRLVERDSCVGVLMMVEDITQEVRHRQEMFAMEKANTLNQVVAGIAHEIKNPLMTIKTAVSLIVDRWEDSNVRNAFVQFIPDEVDRMNTLVQSLLSYSRPPDEDFSVFPLSEVVTRSFHLAQVTDHKSRIRFSLTLDDSLYIRGQRDLLRQALTNLLINSIWAVNEKRERGVPPDWNGTISGYTYEQGEWVDLAISDNGVGMSPEIVARCTDPFFTTKVAGTGLGLALVKQCVENSGGTMEIQSEEQVSTTIIIRFPRCSPENS